MLQQRKYSQMHRSHRALLFQLTIHLQLWNDDNTDDQMGLRTHAFHSRDYRVYHSEQHPYSNKFHNRNIHHPACSANWIIVFNKQKLPDR